MRKETLSMLILLRLSSCLSGCVGHHTVRSTHSVYQADAMHFLPPRLSSLLLHAKAEVDGTVLSAPIETSRPGVLPGVCGSVEAAFHTQQVTPSTAWHFLLRGQQKQQRPYQPQSHRNNIIVNVIIFALKQYSQQPNVLLKLTDWLIL